MKDLSVEDILIKKMLHGKVDEMRLMYAINGFFRFWNENKGERSGLHASSVLVPETGAQQFCYKEQILNMFFLGEETEFSTETLRTFYIGWIIHMGYQSLYKQNNVAKEIEKTHVDPVWELYHTPDLIVDQLGKLWIVEIKTMKSKTFQEHSEKDIPPANGVRQAQLYMHMRGVLQAYVLIHDKNTSAFNVFIVEYDPEFMKPYIVRLNYIRRLKVIFEKDGRLPKGVCSSIDSPRAKNCPLRDACFASSVEREQYRRKSIPMASQINWGAMQQEEAL